VTRRYWTKVQYGGEGLALSHDGVDGGRSGEVGRRLAIGSRIRAAEQFKVRARRLIVRLIAYKVAPYQRRARDVSLFGINNAKQIARVGLSRIQEQRRERLVLRVGEHPAALISNSEIEMRFRMIVAEENGGSETVGRGGEVALLK
jgi:hypothetical protein